MAIAPRRCPPKQCHYPLWTMPFSSQTKRINLRPNNSLGQCVRPGKQGPTLAGGNLGEGLAAANLNGQHLNYPQLTSAASPQPYTPTQTLSSTLCSSTISSYQKFDDNTLLYVFLTSYSPFSYFEGTNPSPSLLLPLLLLLLWVVTNFGPLPSACITNATSSS